MKCDVEQGLDFKPFSICVLAMVFFTDAKIVKVIFKINF